MTQTLLAVAVGIVPLVWGYLVWRFFEAVWPPRPPAAASSQEPTTEKPAWAPHDYQI